MSEAAFKVVLDKDYSLTIQMGYEERMDTMTQLKKAYETHCKMAKWLDDNRVSGDEKDRYQPMFLNLMHSISYLWDLLKKAGVDEKEIKNHLNLPF